MSIQSIPQQPSAPVQKKTKDQKRVTISSKIGLFIAVPQVFWRDGVLIVSPGALAVWCTLAYIAYHTKTAPSLSRDDLYGLVKFSRTNHLADAIKELIRSGFLEMKKPFGKPRVYILRVPENEEEGELHPYQRRYGREDAIGINADTDVGINADTDVGINADTDGARHDNEHVKREKNRVKNKSVCEEPHTPTIQKHPLEPDLTPLEKAVSDVCGIDELSTGSLAYTRMKKAAERLAEIQETPERVYEFGREWKRKYPTRTTPPYPFQILNEWGRLMRKDDQHGKRRETDSITKQFPPTESI